MNRYDKFLSEYIPKYIRNELIQEIIISDENGDDVKKIISQYPDNSKLKLFINDTRLGPFLNKLNACSKASNEWIVLMDSDNFADEKYFIIAKEYLGKNITTEKNIILAPNKANPNFNYSHLSGFIYKKGDFKENYQKEKSIITKENIPSDTLMNTGNYVINKYLIDNIDLNNERENIKKSSACDVIYFNTILFEQLDLNMHIVENLEYDHVVHDGSIYTQTAGDNKEFNNTIYNRYNNLH